MATVVPEAAYLGYNNARNNTKINRRDESVTEFPSR